VVPSVRFECCNPNLSGNHGDHLNPQLHHVLGHHLPAEEAMREKIEAISRQISRLEGKLVPTPARPLERPPEVIKFDALLSSENAIKAAEEIEGRKYVRKVALEDGGPFGEYITVSIARNIPSEIRETTINWIHGIIQKYDDEIPF
jgi:hypothetical protein